MGNEVIPFSTRHEGNLPALSESYFVPARNFASDSALVRIKRIGDVFHNSATGCAFGRLLDAHQPHIIHAHNIYGTLTTSILVEAQLRAIPAVLTAHDTKLVCPTYLCLDHGRVCEACQGKHFYRAAIRRCHRQGGLASMIFAAESYFNRCLKRYEILRRVIAPSQFLKDLLIRNGLSEDRIVHIANGVDVEHILPEFSTGEYLLYAGRLSSEKGILTLIEAMRGTTVPLRIVGDGPLRQQAEHMASGASNIRFEGYRCAKDLAALFRRAACVIQPSEWYENAPMSVLESYAYGKPVIGSRIGGIPELIQPGETGELFEARNVEQLRDVAVQFWNQRDNVRRFGRNARRLVEDKFSLKLHCERLSELYQQLTT